MDMLTAKRVRANGGKVWVYIPKSVRISTLPVNDMDIYLLLIAVRAWMSSPFGVLGVLFSPSPAAG